LDPSESVVKFSLARGGFLGGGQHADERLDFMRTETGAGGERRVV
jgi:hypothetical protein